MSSPNTYTLVDRTESIRSESPVVHLTDESKTDDEYQSSIYRQNILFVYLDLQSELTPIAIASLRAINYDVKTYTDPSNCLDFLRCAHDRIFFISSSADRQWIEEFHDVKSVEAMFIFNSDAQMDARFPKLYGVYGHFEQLLMGLRETLEWFEQNQMELFVFERDQLFLWLQLWKEECIKLQKLKSSSNKEKLVQLAENYYGENTKLHQAINEFNQCYVKSDALQWCFSSPFPSRLLHRALRSHHSEHLRACQFLLTDVSRTIQLASKKSSCELYKGMKMTDAFLDKLENHIGKLICPKGFLLCSQSRKIALTTASSPDHRPDLMPVLFKITYDTSVPLAELSHRDSTSILIFDVFTVFRVKYVSRGQVSTVKIELADGDGKKIARTYRSKHETENIQNLLDGLLAPPKPPARLPPIQQISTLPLESLGLSPNEVGLSVIVEDDNDNEMQAQELVERGDIDQALDIYLCLQPKTARMLSTIGSLYANKKGDFDSAIKYFKKALKMKEEAGEDVSSVLSQLGVIHQNRHEFDLALSCHSRAYYKQKKMSHIDQTSVASCLIGMANAYWGQENLSEALTHAEEALVLNESIERGNDENIATNLAILANIHYNLGDKTKALELAARALGLLERCVPPDSPALATLINNVATMQAVEKRYTDARHSYERALEICKKSLPEGHPKRLTMENNIRRISEMENKNDQETQL